MAKKQKETVPQGPSMAQIGYVPSLQKKYKEEIVDKLMKEFNYSTVMHKMKRTPCEIYTRVMGYLRPVSNYNI